MNTVTKRKFMDKVVRAAQPTSEAQLAAAPGWTAPSAIPPDIAKKILAARDAIIRGETDEAYHQLYSIADPAFENFEPWELLEKQSNDKLCDGGAKPEDKPNE